MKNRRIVIALAFFVFLFTIFLHLYTNDIYKERYHEHLEKDILYPNYNYHNIDALTYNSTTILEENFTSHLPVISFDTLNNEILGGNDKEEKEYTKSIIKVKDGATENYEGFSLIRYRGNSSRFFDKKGLRIKLVKENDKDDDYPLLGLSKDHDFVLHGPYLDKTLIRNYLGYNLVGEVMEYAPNVRFCEVFINNEYQGVYLLVETIKVSKERIKISKYEKNSKISSYLLEVTRKYPSDDSLYFLDNFSNYTMRMKTDSYYNIKYPTSKTMTEELNQYITNDISEFEKILYSYDYDDKNFGYMNYIDIDSFVNYAVFNEFFLNFDAGYNSTYIYKDKIGKYKVASWDMNNIFNNYMVELLKEQDFYFKDRPWFEMLLRDEVFVNRMIRRYKELRSTILSEEYLYQYIDNTIDYLGPAIKRNFVKWGDSFTDEKNLMIPVERNIHSYEEAIKQMKETIHIRGEWLDKNIETLKQFSHESKVKEYNP